MDDNNNTTQTSGWRSYLGSGMEATKGLVYGSKVLMNNEALKTTLGKGSELAKGAVAGSLNYVNDNSGQWKETAGKGSELAKGAVVGSLNYVKDNSGQWKETAGKSSELAKGAVVGSLNYVKDNSGQWKETAGKSVEMTEGFFKGSKVFNYLQGQKYITKITNAGQVNILEKATKNWVFRIDRPHKGADYVHININPKYSGLRRDPHIPLPPGSLCASRGVATMVKIVDKVNEVAIPLAVTIDTIEICMAAFQDIENGTSRNTVEATTKIGAGWVGGYTGGFIGMGVGTSILPGMGTILGGLIGAVAGGVSLASYSTDFVENHANKRDYGIIEQNCVDCEETIRLKKYKGESFETIHKDYCTMKGFTAWNEICDKYYEGF